MVKRFFRLSMLAWVLFVLPLVGCETKRVWLQLEGVNTGVVEGIWLWRFSDELGTYERFCRIPFTDRDLIGGVDSVRYVQECGGADGEPAGIDLHAELKQSGSAPDRVTVGLWYMRWEDPGVYKVSSYGAYGETALSTTSIEL